MDAIEGMSVQYPVYFDEDVLERLLSGAAPEAVLLGALVEMVDRCLDPYENGSMRYEDGVDTLAQSAGEEAVLTLGEFGLMERVSARLGRWTPEGKRFLAEGLQEWKSWNDAEQREEANVVRGDEIRWAKRGLIALCIAAGTLIAGWIAVNLGGRH